MKLPFQIVPRQPEKLDVKLFGYFPEAHCSSCRNFGDCEGETHKGGNSSIKSRLIEKYGDSITVKLVNVFSEDVKLYPEVGEYLKTNGLRVPLLMIGNDIVLKGIETTDDAIQAAIEGAMAKTA